MGVEGAGGGGGADERTWEVSTPDVASSDVLAAPRSAAEQTKQRQDEPR